MQHSVSQIGKEREQFSKLRKDAVLFDASNFFAFAEANETKYKLVRSGEDLLVTTWWVDELLNDYKHTLKRCLS